MVSVIDLRNPTRSNGNNILYLVNKYTDLYATLVRQIIECVVVESKEKIKVVFIGGTEIEMTL